MPSTKFNLHFFIKAGLITSLFVLFFCLELSYIPNFLPSDMKLNLSLAAFFVLPLYFKEHTYLLYICAIILGGISDLVLQAPLGLNILIYGLAIWFSDLQRRYLETQSFAAFWLAYALLAFFIQIISWVVHSMSTGVALPLYFAVSPYIFSIMTFPIVFTCLAAIQQLIKPREEISEIP